jgi:endogenous inhibitor of DNA gyrase (YacG/DUF329 family)
MAGKKSRTLRCPTCRTLVLQNDPDFPFCSERCRTIDLGKWASGAYRISSPALDPELIEEESPRPRPDDDHDGPTH